MIGDFPAFDFVRTLRIGDCMYLTHYKDNDVVAIRFEDSPDKERPEPDITEHVFSFLIMSDDMHIQTQAGKVVGTSNHFVGDELDYGPVEIPIYIQISVDKAGKLNGVVVRNANDTVSSAVSLLSAHYECGDVNSEVKNED